jgi:hypothetical protein
VGACCCSLAGTPACWTCPNSMSGTGDRYPAPYVNPTRFDENYLLVDRCMIMEHELQRTISKAEDVIQKLKSLNERCK